ncbi:MAG: hypothetical protein MUE52_18975 [Tabrizicola sp.]|jgi:hypothetical protein|nr:hypothetical protein [Tabrizicola sp.]
MRPVIVTEWVNMSVPRLENVAKNFGAIEALNGVSLTIEKGQVIGLMGATAEASRRWSRSPPRISAHRMVGSV